VVSFQSYCAGLLLPGDRKSVEPMAIPVQPGRVQAAKQSLHHFLAKAGWSDDAVLAAARARVLPVIEWHGAIRALIVDETAIPKKGTHSFGGGRQYCWQLGKQDNCQVAVSLSAAHDHASLPIAYRLYLPNEWADDPDRRAGAGVPDEIVFQTKPQIALDRIRAARAAGLPADMVLADAGYGNDTEFRDDFTAIGLAYAVGIGVSTTLWPLGTAPLPPKHCSGPGRRASAIRADGEHQPVLPSDWR
jgi:SRSO17 transposase